MKEISAKGLFFTSSLFYFIATAIGTETLLGDGFRLIAVFCLLFGILKHYKEKRSGIEKK